MPRELTLSIMSTTRQQAEYLRQCLTEFEAKTRIHVNLQLLDWNTGRSELVKMALYRHGADVSDVGSTWISDFVGMNALRPFTIREIDALGGEKTYVPAAWKAGVPLGDNQVWAVPWVTSAVIIAYRKDILAQAGVEVQDAFSTHQQIGQALEQIKSIGWETPLALPMATARYGTLHNVASWLWGTGNEIISSDGRSVTFDRPAALEAMQMYFGLHRFISPELFTEEKRAAALRTFWEGKTAMAITGSWLLGPSPNMTPEVEANLGVALLPGATFVGSQNLVIWQHTRSPADAVALAQYLMQPEVQAEHAIKLNLMPARLDLLSSGRCAKPPCSIAARAAITGRTFPTMPLLGLVEDKFSMTLGQIWEEIGAHPGKALGAIIRDHLLPLARQLNLTLGH